MKSFKYIILFIFFLCTVNCQNAGSEIVACINNAAITKSELKHWMLLEKSNVYNYFFRKFGVQDSDHFWTEKQGNEIPLEKLKETALESIKRCKLQQLLALEKGIVITTNFDEIMNDLEKVNVERARKVENGVPIYGPKQFTSRTYFSHVFDKMVISLKNELSKNELKPTNEQLQWLLDKSIDSNKDLTGFLTMQYVDNNYNAFIDNLMNSCTVKINNEVYKRIKI